VTMMRILAALGACILLGTASARSADAAPPVLELGGYVEEADGTVRVRGIVEITDGYHINAHVPDEEMKHSTFTHPTVLRDAARFAMLQADVTESSGESERLLEEFRVLGVPTIIFYDSTGRAVDRVVGFVDADELRRLMLRAEGGSA